MKRLIAHELGACTSDNQDLVSHATHLHENAYPLYDGKPHNWRRVVTNRVKFNHDESRGPARATLWHATY
jgi:hypothetical protein